jgi:hypothetical protein
MTTHKNSQLAAVRARIKRTWSELDYANRRMFDIRTGEHFIGRQSEKEPRERTTRRTAVPAR